MALKAANGLLTSTILRVIICTRQGVRAGLISQNAFIDWFEKVNSPTKLST